MSNYRLFGEFTTLSPLSHIGESISTITYLVEEPILQPSGQIEPVFSYNGNAWRGQLRDLAAGYMLDKLGCTVSLDAFHLLFSGGKIGGDQSINLSQARMMRRAVPMISVFGGGVGNQILPGKMRVGASYPVCIEAMPVLRERYYGDCLKTSYRQMTMEKSYSRMDDGKNPNLMQRINEQDALLLESGDKKSKKDGEVSTQMRMTSELLIAGVKLVHEIDLIGVSEIELGVIASAIHAFSASPYIGGQCNRGHGKVSYASRIVNMDSGEDFGFIKIDGDGNAKLAQPAQSAKNAYDQHLLEQYNNFLQSAQSEIAGLLGAG
jgi:CRISPR type IV-associated protein Csf2